jgi:hypothetical protein
MAWRSASKRREILQNLGLSAVTVAVFLGAGEEHASRAPVASPKR